MLFRLNTSNVNRGNIALADILRFVADWPMGQNLFLMSHPDVSLVNILLSITRVSLVQNKCVFCQLRVHFIGDPGITKTYLGIQHAIILQYLHELNGNVHYRPLSRRLDRCDRVIQKESGDPNGGNMCSFSGATCTSRVRHNAHYVPCAQIRFDL